ncbi:hypothetical protein JCM30760_21140 [Thiomicrorhabdus hydrogeniphila]
MANKRKRRGNHKGKILTDYKKVGSKLIPPLLQLPMVQETSFVDKTLPNLIWMSAIFLRAQDKIAVDTIMDFIVRSTELLGDDNHLDLAFLDAFSELSKEQKKTIYDEFKDSDTLDFICDNVAHQHFLIDDYPLAFLFDDFVFGVDREEAIESLKEDVGALLDRYSPHSVKVQATAFISMNASGRCLLSSEMNLPDFNSIFINPYSEESRRVGGFVRANLNAMAGMRQSQNQVSVWPEYFWEKSYFLAKCE